MQDFHDFPPLYGCVDTLLNLSVALNVYHQTEGFAAKDKGPPFFRGATSHYFWLSRWCSYMVKRSNEKRAGPWSSLFFACRTAFRTPVGLRIAEFIAPLLVLDGLCFGDQSDRKTIVEELRDVFVTEETAGSLNVRLNHSEHRKAVNTAFMIIETLQYWAETRTEEVHNQSKRSSASNGSNVNAGSWSSDDSTFQIDEMLTKISLLLQAKAAASVGMHARALRLVEMAARANLVEEVYDASVSDQKTTSPKCKWRSSRSFGNHRLFDIDMDLLKNVLAELNDCDTMGALEEDGSNSNPIERTLDSIRQNEASGNWEGALRDYERIQQLQGLQGCDIRMKKGALRCLLELGQFESVINQVRGISASVELLPDDEGQRKATKAAQVKPLAVEASWRLGKWSTLSGLIDQDGLQSESGRHLDSEGIYRIANGEAMLALYKKDPESVSSAVRIARQAVMDGLSNVARESYSRAYPFLVRLHCLRELEDTKDFLCDKSIPDDLLGGVAADCVSRESWNWQRRLDLVAPSSAGPVISTRLAVARLSGDYALEGSLLLSAGKKARKNGLFNIASDLLAQAEASLNTMSRDACEKGADSLLGKINMQLAKLRHDSGQSSAALKMLGEESVHHLIELKKEDADKIIVAQETYTFGHNAAHPDNAGLVQRFACRVLQSTKWMIEGGLKDGAEIINRFKVVVKVAPRMEKGTGRDRGYTNF